MDCQMFASKLKKIKFDILVSVQRISDFLYLSMVEVYLSLFYISSIMIYWWFLMSFFTAVNNYACTVM